MKAKKQTNNRDLMLIFWSALDENLRPYADVQVIWRPVDRDATVILEWHRKPVHWQAEFIFQEMEIQRFGLEYIAAPWIKRCAREIVRHLTMINAMDFFAGRRPKPHDLPLFSVLP
jgi:hypothetical protein